jgi:hypothetical protein
VGQAYQQSSGFRRLLARFPGSEDAIRLAAIKDQRFRALCDDLLLAIETLDRFEGRPDAALRTEIPEYRLIIAEMEAELVTYIAEMRRG